MARPTKLTPHLQDVFFDAIRSGAPRKVAARMAGIAESTLYDWLRRGQDLGHRGFSEFSKRLRYVEDEVQAELVGRIVTRARVDWRAAAWMLVMRWPELYGPRAQNTAIEVDLRAEMVRSRVAVRERLLMMNERLEEAAMDSPEEES